MFFNKNRYELDMTTANNALQNILSSCNQPVNTIPFDKLVLRKKSECRLLQPPDRCHDTDLRADLLSPLAIVPLSEMTENCYSPHLRCLHWIMWKIIF